MEERVGVGGGGGGVRGRTKNRENWTARRLAGPYLSITAVCTCVASGLDLLGPKLADWLRLDPLAGTCIYLYPSFAKDLPVPGEIFEEGGGAGPSS